MNIPQHKRMLTLSSLFAGAGLSLAIATVVSVQTVAIPTPSYEASVNAWVVPNAQPQVGRGTLQQDVEQQRLEEESNLMMRHRKLIERKKAPVR